MDLVNQVPYNKYIGLFLWMGVVVVCLSTETGLDTVGGLDGVDIGVELGMVRQLLPLDQGIGQGEGLGELGLGEGAEEGRVLVTGELTLIETVDGVRLGLEKRGLEQIQSLGTMNQPPPHQRSSRQSMACGTGAGCRRAGRPTG